jgi:hypothetical protein
MSVWTHVAGVIRVDDIRSSSSDIDWKSSLMIKLESNDVLGKQVTSYDSWKTYDKSTNPIPCGSEGSVQYYITEREDTSLISSGEIVIYGDLRSYDDVDYVVKWFKSACDKLWVR